MRQTDYLIYGDDMFRYQVTYPEAYIFAHSRHTYIDIDHLNDIDGYPEIGSKVTMTVTDRTTSRSYSETRRIDQNGKAVFDIGRFLQVFMDETLKDDCEFDYSSNSKMVSCHEVAASLTFGSSQFWTETFEVVNGADEITDNWWDGQRRIRWWYNFPFTFDFRNIDEANVQKNGGASLTVNMPHVTPDPHSYSRIRVNPKYFGNNNTSLMVWTTGGIGFLDGSFSYTKQNSVLLSGIGCVPSEKYLYLRWLNRHGELSYWLFYRDSVSRKTKENDSVRSYVKDERIGPDGTIDNSLLRTLELESEIKGFTDALDGNDYEIVRQIFAAPFVDLYLPDQSVRLNKAVWKRLNIKAGTYQEELRHSDAYTVDRHVIITLTLPEEGQLFI